MSNKLPYSHLLYVQQYSIADNGYNLVVYGVNIDSQYYTIAQNRIVG